MTETEPLTQPTDTDSKFRIDPCTAEGRSRLLLMGGMGWLAIGTLVDVALVVWGGVLIIAGAFALNTVGKLVHYRDLPISQADRVTLSATWLLLAATVVSLLTNYAYTRYGPGAGRYFWALAVAGIGFGLLYMAAQSLYLPEQTETTH